MHDLTVSIYAALFQIVFFLDILPATLWVKHFGNSVIDKSIIFYYHRFPLRKSWVDLSKHTSVCLLLFKRPMNGISRWTDEDIFCASLYYFNIEAPIYSKHIIQYLILYYPPFCTKKYLFRLPLHGKKDHSKTPCLQYNYWHIF